MGTMNERNAMMLSTPSELEIVTTRVFDAPRELVWAVWTRPEHLPHWMFGPEGWTMTACDADVRPGGAWHYEWSHTDGSVMQMEGVYQEVAEPELLVSTENWGGDWEETLNTVVLSELDERTTVTLTVRYPSKKARDAALQTGMTDGMALSYDRAEDYLLTLS
jgi:uncharacterized protein YndB with AHSA1/START domain